MERVRRDQEETSEDQNVLRGEGVSTLRKAFGWGKEWREASLSWRGSVRVFYYLQGQEDRRKEKYRIIKFYFCINSLHYSFSTCFSPVCSQIRVFISFLAIKSLPLRDSLLQVVLTPPASGQYRRGHPVLQLRRQLTHTTPHPNRGQGSSVWEVKE